MKYGRQCWQPYVIDLTGRGEWIRTTDLTVPNDRRGKNISLCLFESCNHQGISRVLHPFPFLNIRYRSSAENSVHKLATRHPNTLGELKQLKLNTEGDVNRYHSTKNMSHAQRPNCAPLMSLTLAL